MSPSLSITRRPIAVACSVQRFEVSSYHHVGGADRLTVQISSRIGTIVRATRLGRRDVAGDVDFDYPGATQTTRENFSWPHRLSMAPPAR
jgi:hypothetical protein